MNEQQIQELMKYIDTYRQYITTNTEAIKIEEEKPENERDETIIHRAGARREVYGLVVSDLLGALERMKASSETHKLVVRMQMDCFDGVMTTAPEGSFDAVLHEYDDNRTPEIVTMPTPVEYVDEAEIAPYFRAHAMTMHELVGFLENLEDSDEIVVGVQFWAGLAYYPVTDFLSFSGCPFGILRINDNRPIEIGGES